jgi:hypothetical protein
MQRGQRVRCDERRRNSFGMHYRNGPFGCRVRAEIFTTGAINRLCAVSSSSRQVSLARQVQRGPQTKRAWSARVGNVRPRIGLINDD